LAEDTIVVLNVNNLICH